MLQFHIRPHRGTPDNNSCTNQDNYKYSHKTSFVLHIHKFHYKDPDDHMEYKPSYFRQM